MASATTAMAATTAERPAALARSAIDRVPATTTAILSTDAAARKRQEEKEMLERVLNAKPFNYTEAEVQRDLKRYAPRPFSLLR